MWFNLGVASAIAQRMPAISNFYKSLSAIGLKIDLQKNMTEEPAFCVCALEEIMRSAKQFTTGYLRSSTLQQITGIELSLRRLEHVRHIQLLQK